MIGRLIGNCKILEQQSFGGQNAIYKAIDLSLKRLVAVKVLDRESASSPPLAESFRREASVLARTNHPCVPALHALLESDGEMFMIGEFAEGETLAAILQRGKLSAEKALKISEQIFDCLDYAHRNETFHGALHGGDVVVSDSGWVKILNFGASASDNSRTASAKSKNDIQAVAVLIYEMLAGKKLFAAETEPLDALKNIEAAITPEHLSNVKSDLPGKLGELIATVLRPKKIDPFQTIGAFRSALAANGFGISDNADSISAVQNSDEAKINSENDSNVSAERQIYEKDFAVCTVNFFENSSSRLIGDANAKPTIAPLKKSGAKRYKIAAAAVLLVLVTHFVWQFSFIQEENLRAAENESELAQPIEKPVIGNRIETSAKSAIETPIKPNENASVREDVEEDESPRPIKIVKIAAPSAKRQPEPKPSQKNASATARKPEPIRETRAERLRRAEKLLTGF